MADLRISDHAVLRWLERASGVDVESARARMAASLDRAHRAALALGVVNYLIVIDDLVHVVRGGVVVTVLPNMSPGARAAALRMRST